jgi:tRNA1(Val) A37 N6-methylase TrmN6
LQGSQRRAAGLADTRHDYVILNPPFNSGADRTTPDTLKAQAHAMDSNDLFERGSARQAPSSNPVVRFPIIARPNRLATFLRHWAALWRRRNHPGDARVRR